jgi:CTLH/CRA C-terminal to LisH motif domain
MGYKVSKYSLLKTESSSIELEEFPSSHKVQYSLQDLSFQCQSLIISGHPLEAYKLIKFNPIDFSELYLPLHSQEFIELIKKKKYIDGLLFAQKNLGKYKNCSFILNAKENPVEICVKTLMGLLCYESPEESPLSYLLDPSIRYFVAQKTEDIINPRQSKSICLFFKCCKKKRS